MLVLSVPTVRAMETGPLLFTHTFTYKFPPLFLVQKALRKTQEDRVNVILITWNFTTFGNTLLMNPHRIGGHETSGMINFK